MTDKELHPSVRVIDLEINTILRRIDNINNNLHDGIHGESPKNEEEEDSKELPSESLTSIVRKIERIQGMLNLTEEYVNRIHINGDVGSTSSS